MKLILCELKKLLKNRIIFVALAVFIALDLFNIYRNYNISNGVEDYYVNALLQLEEQLDGKINEEKINLINSKYNELTNLANGEYRNQQLPDRKFLTGYAFWDLEIWGKYKNYIDNATAYNENIVSKTQTALDNIDFYSGKNDYYASENLCYYNTYANRRITEVYDTERLPDYFSYSFSSVLCVILLLLGVIPMFCSEKENDMEIILLTSSKGRRITVGAKIISSIIFTVTVVTAFEIINFFGFMYFSRLDGLSQNVYAVQGYEFVPFECKVWQFCLILYLFRLLGMCVISLVFLLLSRIFKSSVISFVLGTIVFFSLMMCKTFLTSEAGFFANLFNPVTALTSYNLFQEFQAVNMFGTPVLSSIVTFMTSVLIVIVLLMLIAFLPLKAEIKLLKRRAQQC